MSTSTLSTNDKKVVLSDIKPYWDFARSPANQGKNIVRIEGSKLGIAAPLSFDEKHITFLNKHGEELRSDETKKMVNHFKSAITTDYSKYGADFVNSILDSEEFDKAEKEGLSHHFISQVYKKICNAEGKNHLDEDIEALSLHGKINSSRELAKLSDVEMKADLVVNIYNDLNVALKNNSSEKSEALLILKAYSEVAGEACHQAESANPKNAKEYMQEVEKQVQLSKKIMNALRDASCFFPEGSKEIKKILEDATRSFSKTLSYAKEVKEIVDRNHRLSQGPSIMKPHTPQNNSELSDDEGNGTWRNVPDVTPEKEMNQLESAHTLALRKLEEEEQIAQLKVASASVFEKLDKAKTTKQRGWRPRF